LNGDFDIIDKERSGPAAVGEERLAEKWEKVGGKPMKNTLINLYYINYFYYLIKKLARTFVPT